MINKKYKIEYILFVDDETQIEFKSLDDCLLYIQAVAKIDKNILRYEIIKKGNKK